MSEGLSLFTFRLSDDFVETYKKVKAPFGYADAAGNSVVRLCRCCR